VGLQTGIVSHEAKQNGKVKGLQISNWLLGPQMIQDITSIC